MGRGNAPCARDLDIQARTSFVFQPRSSFQTRSRFLMKALELPEILWVIGFLDYPRLAAATTVCKSWNTIFNAVPLSHARVGRTLPARSTFFCRQGSRPPYSCHQDILLSLDPFTCALYTPREAPSRVRCTRALDTSHKPCPSKPRTRHSVRHQAKQFLEAVFTCSPQLRRLEISGPSLVAFEMADPFFNVCLRLEELKMVDLTLDITGDASWINWPTAFPTIKKLWIGFNFYEQCTPHQLQRQHEFIQRCPNLESLTWSFSHAFVSLSMRSRVFYLQTQVRVQRSKPLHSTALDSIQICQRIRWSRS